MTLLKETSIEVVVAPPPADSPQPHHLNVDHRLSPKGDVVCTTSSSTNRGEGHSGMEQDQESPSLTTASSELVPRRPTLKKIATSVSLDPLPTLKEEDDDEDEKKKNKNRVQRRSRIHVTSLPCPPMRQREVSFDISYSAHTVQRSRSDSRYVAAVSDEDDSSTTSSTTTEGEEEDLHKRPTWVPDAEAPQCHHCTKGFTFFRRRHHCRACGGVFCGACSSNRITIPRLEYTSFEVRVCDHCWVREAELRYRKPSVSSVGSLFASCSVASSSSSSSVRRRRRTRRQSLSKSSEVQINNHILKRSLRNMELAAAAAVAKVQAEKSEGGESPKQPPSDERIEDVSAGHEREQNQ